MGSGFLWTRKMPAFVRTPSKGEGTRLVSSSSYPHANSGTCGSNAGLTREGSVLRFASLVSAPSPPTCDGEPTNQSQGDVKLVSVKLASLLWK